MDKSSQADFRVVVLDDVPAVLELLCDFIALEGFEVLGFPGPLQSPFFQQNSCFLNANESCAHALVTDLAMPGKSGLDLIDHLKAIGCKCPNIAVISGQLTPQISAELGARGVAAFEKPGVFPALTNWLHECRRRLPNDWRLVDWPPPGTVSPTPVTGGWKTDTRSDR